jgi:PII-like signaling protein
MHIEGPGKLLTIYLSEADKWHHRSLFMAIVERAKKEGLAGATVLRGVAGFGAHSRIHTANILVLSADLPIVIQIVDQAERIQKFLPILDEMVPEGLITLQDVDVVRYRHRDQ